MSVMDTREIEVGDVQVGMLVLVRDRIFAGVKEYEDGQGVRTLHLFGYGTRTLGWHQSITIGG